MTTTSPLDAPHLEVAYLVVETTHADLDPFLTDIIGLVPGEVTADGFRTFRDDAAVHRLLVADGPADDATVLGIEAFDHQVAVDVIAQLTALGVDVHEGTVAERAARRVEQMWHVTAPWGVRVELVTGLARTEGVEAPLVPGGFLTDGVGFGHVVFATTGFDEADRFVVEGLGLRRSDWIETELAPGVPLEVHFYHCNPRHHSVAIARLPFDLPTSLHHVMFETVEVDDTGRAFDRAVASGRPIANSLGRHDNDEMFSFYVVSPAGFQVEVGHGARVITNPWTDDRKYSDISRWGHQPLPAS